MNKYYCWREVETQTGCESQYLDSDGGIVTDSNLRAYFPTEDEARNHCAAHAESGEIDFQPQSCFVMPPKKEAI